MVLIETKLKKMEAKTENKWPDEVRLKMIEKSEFYPGEERIYQYGFYDGYQFRDDNKEPKLIKISEKDFKNIKVGDKLLGFQKAFKAVDIRTVDGVWRPDFDMIDYYLIEF